MALQGFYVRGTEREYVEPFIERHHYSKSINGCKCSFCYGLYNPLGKMVGAMFLGKLAMMNQYKPYVENESDIIELRRLCCVDDTPKNAESFFISRALKLLKKEWGGVLVISYADKEYGHSGIIYKASNFKQLKDVPGAKKILYQGKLYHDKTIRTKYGETIKPYAQKIKDALDNGEASYRGTKGKCVFTYRLREKPVLIKPKQISMF